MVRTFVTNQVYALFIFLSCELSNSKLPWACKQAMIMINYNFISLGKPRMPSESAVVPPKEALQRDRNQTMVANRGDAVYPIH